MVKRKTINRKPNDIIIKYLILKNTKIKNSHASNVYIG